jgi:hypothetical protein
MSFLREPNAEPIPGYLLIEPLGSGGFGEVWKCEAPGGLFKAIKFVYGNLNSLDVDSVRADQERHALERIKLIRHPFILSMDRIETVDGELIIVMELADKSLHDCFEECLGQGLRGIPQEQLWRYIRDAAEALDHMNEVHNLQHLDIKPRNLFLVSDHVKVADFGLVKNLERSNHSLNGVTPLYAAPETFESKISTRSDQYSLAIVFTELLTGQRPFNGKNARTLAHQHINEEPELRMLPEADRPVLARALSKDPNKRFPSCMAFVRALHLARVPATRAEINLQDEMGPPADAPASRLLDDFALDGHDLEVVDLKTPADLQELSPDEVSALGLTMALPQTGALRPTLLVGLGSQGRRALLELRCRFLDRFGDLDKVPLFRFLYVDTDVDAIKEALRGAPELAFKSHEIYHLPLQPVSHYRRRQLDYLNDWLPREKLYALPRSLKTQGSRALGRLAFADNHQRLLARLRREIQQACHPDSLYQTVNQTGLAIRDNVPRVYVIGCASGGASGYVADLGYSLRRLLMTMRQPEAPVTSFLLCGAPDDPATPGAEQANLYATLTELNHFADPTIPFSAQYGVDGPRLVMEQAPFDRTYLLTFRHRTPECRRNTMAHLGSYLFHELTTPLGIRLEHCRQKNPPADALPFRSLGTFGVWFPRGLMLRLAAQRACRVVLEEWLAEGEPSAGAELEAAQARILADPELLPETLTNRIAEAATAHLDGLPGDMLTRQLVALEELSQQMMAQDDPGTWAQQALGRIQDWLGNGITPPGAVAPTEARGGGGLAVGLRKSRLTKALETAAQELAEQWEGRLMETAMGLMEHPGRRLAVAEVALKGFQRYCDESAAAFATRTQQRATLTQSAQASLRQALENCVTGGGGFNWFGGRARRLVRVFMDHLAAFARQCLADDLAATVLHFFAHLRGRLGDRLRDLTVCRQSLRRLQEVLEAPTEVADDQLDGASSLGMTANAGPGLSAESYWESIRESTTARVVLPNGLEDLDEAAGQFLNTLTADHWVHLDQTLQDQVLAARGGLFKVCMQTGDLDRHLTPALLGQGMAVLGNLLPITDVAEVELSVPYGESDTLAARIQDYHEQAVPVLGAAVAAPAPAGGGFSTQRLGSRPEEKEPVSGEHSFLLIPGSEAGKSYGDQAQEALQDIHIVNVPGQADLMFCRELSYMRVTDIEYILQHCRNAYEEAILVPNTSPHGRFDIQDWTPLDP